MPPTNLAWKATYIAMVLRGAQAPPLPPFSHSVHILTWATCSHVTNKSSHYKQDGKDEGHMVKVCQQVGIRRTYPSRKGEVSFAQLSGLACSFLKAMSQFFWVLDPLQKITPKMFRPSWHKANPLGLAVDPCSSGI